MSVPAHLPGKLNKPVAHLNGSPCFRMANGTQNISRLQSRRPRPDERKEVVPKMGQELRFT